MPIIDAVSLDRICEPISEDLKRVESKLLERTASTYDFVDVAVQHVIEGGGKRLRPILLLLSSKACGYQGEARHHFAALVELIHVASLVHDDVIDEAPLRRGRETLHAKWGNKVAVLVGDYLHAHILSMLVAYPTNERVLHLIAEATQAMCEGEVIHAYKKRDFDISQDDYLKIVSLKTGKLIVAAVAIGAALANKPKYLEVMTDYGTCLGVAFQVIDDLLDFTADAEAFGKQPFNDLREGKLTLPLIYTRDRCSPAELKNFKEVFLTETRTEDQISWLGQLLEKHGAKEYVIRIAGEYTERAKKALGGLEPSPACRALEQLADYVILRDH